MYPGWRGNYLRYKTYFLNVMGRYRERADVRAYLEILLSLATISVFGVFALRPTLLTIAELIKDIESKRSTLTQMEDKIKNLAAAQTLYDRERPKIVLLETSIPQRAEPIVFARQIEGLSSKHQSAVLGITTGGALIYGEDSVNAEDKNLEEEGLDALPEGTSGLTYSVETTSTLENYVTLANFLSDFEKLRMVSKFDFMKVSTVEVENLKILVMRVEGRLPYYKSEE